MPIYIRIVFIITIYLCQLHGLQIFAQQTVVRGTVTDAATGEPLGFAAVAFDGTPSGTFTDEKGFYELKTQKPGDSVSFIFYGYKTLKIAVQKGIEQEINAKLDPSATSMKEFVLTNREDPAYKVIRQAIRQRDRYDKRKLRAYEYESFTRILGSFDKIPKSLRDKPVGKDIASVLQGTADENGNVSFPFFASEAVSRYYYRSNPEKSTEKVLGTRVSGVFVEDGTLISQIIGASFQNYNFYENWMTIIDKDFISPIAEGALGFYDYRMLDTITTGDRNVFKIAVDPKREQDLAFTGTIWIVDSLFYLKKVKVEVSKNANINYVKGIRISQQLVPTPSGPLLPEYTEVYLRLSPFSESATGLESQFKTFNSDFVVDEPKALKFYEYPIEVDEEAAQRSEQFWEQKRGEPLTDEEKKVYAVIDTVKNLPRVKTYVEVIDIAVNGYYSSKYLDLGPYMSLYAWNDIEGSRFRAGARTNLNFSNRWVLRGYGAYGTRDNKFKYAGEVGYILNRKDWTKVTASYKYDLDQIAIPEDKLEENNNLFLAFTRWGTLRGPTYNRTADISLFRQITKDYSQKITFRNREYNAVFPFAYYDGNGTGALRNDLTATEIILDARYARDELFVINDNDRISLGTKSWPVFKLRAVLGLKDVIGSQFSYQKFDFTLSDNFKVGLLGRSYYDLTVGSIFGTVPLPLLEVHLGNQTPFYTTAGYNLMNYFEFASDRYASLKYRHYFQGLFFNRIPLIKKLNWRFLTTANVLYGGLSDRNKNLNSPYDQTGRETFRFQSLGNLPYVEVGYGIENIFKILRIDAFHRLTYLGNPSARKFGIKFSFQFTL
jgi:hypothetical protein